MCLKVNRKYLVIIICSLVVSIITMTIAYAALNVTLNISGNATVVSSKWDIYLYNAIVSTGSVSDVELSIDGTSAEFSVELNKPGDFYEFTIDVVNDGDIDAEINSVKKTPTITEEQAKYFNYVITYNNGSAIDEKQIVESGNYVRLKVRVDYRNDLVADDLPSNVQSFNLGFELNYIQSSGEDNTIVENSGNYAVKVLDGGDGTAVGDRIGIKDEVFRVLKSDGDEITLFAEYNLNLTNNYQSNSKSGTVDLTNLEKYHSLKFVDTPYWSFESYAAPYPYVYDENSNLYPYVEKYKNYLISLGMNVLNARLINWSELELFGCTSFFSSCNSTYTWASSSQFYWTGVAYSADSLWSGHNSGMLVYTKNTSNYGVRPVIVIPSSSIL